MFLHVTNAKPLDGYRVEVCFDGNYSPMLSTARPARAI